MDMNNAYVNIINGKDISKKDLEIKLNILFKEA